MDNFGFFCDGSSLFCDTAFGTFFMLFYVMFILPIVLIVLLFKFRKLIIDNVYKSLLVLSVITLAGIFFSYNEPGVDAMAAALNFVLLPGLIAGSLYWRDKLDEKASNYKLKSAFLLAHAVMLGLVFISNFVFILINY